MTTPREVLAEIVKKIREARPAYFSKNGGNYLIRFTDMDLQRFENALSARAPQPKGKEGDRG